MIPNMMNILQQCQHQFAGPFQDQMMISHPINIRIFLLFMIAGIAFAILIKFLVAWIVYKDAVAKNVDNRKIWFFLVFVTSILGVIFYFLMVIYQHKNGTVISSSTVASSASQSQNTTSTTPQNDNNSRICKNCGTEGDGKFCARCGTKFI